MGPTYRFGRRASYAIVLSRLAIALVAATLVGCSEERPARPQIVSVGSQVPTNWPQPRRTNAASPQIEALRFSTLDVALGSEWNGDAVASLDTSSVEVKTNLFDLNMPQTGPGRFHFAVHMLDLPAFLVRPYALHVVARARDGRETTLVVPFRIHGRV